MAQEEMEATNPVYAQDEELIKPWINAHHLKKVEGVWYCNATTGIIVRRAFGVLVLRRVKLYQGFSSMMHKYRVELRSRLV